MVREMFNIHWLVFQQLKNIFNSQVFFEFIDKLPEIPEEILTHQVLEEELTKPIYGTEAKRHLLQTASLLGHLSHADLVHENTCFIEFGAGRGI